MRQFILAGTMVVATTIAGLWKQDLAVAQYGSGSRQPGSGTRIVDNRSPSEIFQDRFWAYLKKGPVGYDEWGPFPGRDAGLYEGKSPHGATLRMFANKIARQNPKELPNGSIIIKENYGPEGKTLMAVTVMYRSRGYNPAAGDWYWIKYLPNGTVDRTPAEKGNKRIAGKFASCIECHSTAAGDDYTFAND